MRNAIMIGLIATLALAAPPAAATHTDTAIAPYLGGAGATVDDGSSFPPTFGIVWCPGVEDLGLGCLGGVTAYSDHYADDDWASGYTRATAIAQDSAFSTNVALWVCLHSETATDQCNNFNDWITRSCGVGSTTADTHDYQDRAGDSTDPGFKAIWAVLFIDTFFVDATTSNVCTASTGTISVTFSA